MENNASKQCSNSWLRFTWRIARPLVIAYLVVVLIMMLLEPWVVYPRPAVELGDWNPTGLNHEEVWFESADGTRLHGWFIRHANPKHAIVYCHGNGEHIAFNADLAANLRDSLQASVFMFDYRGYGRSEGSPNEDGCIADGCAAQHWLATTMNIKPNEVVLVGRSLGSAVALAAAAKNGAQAVVLENGFTSMPDIAAPLYPFLPVRFAMENRYDCLEWIARYRGPIFQTHGEGDELMPLAMSRRLFDASPSDAKRWASFPGLGHNSRWPATYYDELARFLAHVTP